MLVGLQPSTTSEFDIISQIRASEQWAAYLPPLVTAGFSQPLLIMTAHFLIRKPRGRASVQANTDCQET